MFPPLTCVNKESSSSEEDVNEESSSSEEEEEETCEEEEEEETSDEVEKELRESIERVLLQNGDDWNKVKTLLLLDPKSKGYVLDESRRRRRSSDEWSNSGPIHYKYARDPKSTAVLLTSYIGYASILKLLIQNGARADAVDLNNVPALFIASEKGNVNVVKVLCQHGVDVNTRCPKKCCKYPHQYRCKETGGKSALYIASVRGHADVVNVLTQQYGANVNLIYNRLYEKKVVGGQYWVDYEPGLTSLYSACEEGNFNVVKVLCRAGADVNALVEHWLHFGT